MSASIRPNDLGGSSVICPVHGWVLTAPDRDTVESAGAAHADCTREGDIDA